MNEILMKYMRHEANGEMINGVNKGEINLEEDEELISTWLAANLVDNTDILDILQAVNLLVMEGMAQEYVSYFINKVKEIANKSYKL